MPTFADGSIQLPVGSCCEPKPLSCWSECVRRLAELVSDVHDCLESNRRRELSSMTTRAGVLGTRPKGSASRLAEMRYDRGERNSCRGHCTCSHFVRISAADGTEVLPWAARGTGFLSSASRRTAARSVGRGAWIQIQCGHPRKVDNCNVTSASLTQ